MGEKPILFSAPMVRAILAGQKTQTRRVVKPPYASFARRPEFNIELSSRRHVWLAYKAGEPGDWKWIPCPYGQPGDRLWVRETFAHIYRHNKPAPVERKSDDVIYRADGHGIDAYAFGRWCPSIHMPRWASRITLEITSVRVERLQAISASDAIAEGIPAGGPENPDGIEVREFRALWESINGADSWAANPWVWVVEFRRAAAAIGGTESEGESQ